MRRRRLHPLVRLVAVIAALTMVAAACGDDESDDENGAGAPDDTEQTDGGDQAACDSISIGWIPWDEDIVVTELWAVLLEDAGYEVETTQSDAAPVFQGVAKGDLDLFFDAWLPATHAPYWEEFGEELEDLATWYDQGTLNIAVPEYVEIDSIAELAGNADMFGAEIIGIEAGAGLMRTTQEEAIPTYGLDDYTLVESSTPAMLAELERAIGDEEPIVVTLWHPHWAYSVYPIKDLEDPEGAMGGAEELHAVARPGFTDDCPEVSGWISDFELNDEQLAELEDIVLNQYESGQEEEGIREWLSGEGNQELVDSWMS
ncbi:MAG: glycine betaine ABC transporter substrate-binding protein [Acidimicrobiia bacterium]|nr:glycine betaine ABC transporter substrate-binding protein [Acidimicrobiia bacterium]